MPKTMLSKVPFVFVPSGRLFFSAHLPQKKTACSKKMRLIENY